MTDRPASPTEPEPRPDSDLTDAQIEYARLSTALCDLWMQRPWRDALGPWIYARRPRRH